MRVFCRRSIFRMRPLMYSLGNFCESLATKETLAALLDPRFETENLLEQIRRSPSDLGTLFQDIKEHNVHIAPIVMNEIMKITRGPDSIDLAYKLLKEYQFKTTNMYNTLLQKLRDAPHPTLTIPVLFEEILLNQLLPNEDTLTIMTEYYIEEHQPDKAKENLLKHFRRFDIGDKPFFVLLDFYRKRLDCKSMEVLVTWMFKNGFSGSPTVFHQVVMAYKTAGKINQVKKVMWLARVTKNYEVHPETCLLVLNYFKNRKFANDAIRLFEKLPEYGIKPTPPFYFVLIDVLSNARRRNEAAKYFEQLFTQNMPVREFQVSSKRFIKNGAHGLYVLQKLDDANCSYTIDIPLLTIKKLLEEGNYDASKKLFFQFADTCSEQLDSLLVVFLKYLLNDKKSYSDIEEVLYGMTKRGYRISEMLFVELFESYSPSENMNNIYSLLKLMYEFLIPSEDSYFALFKLIAAQEDKEDISTFLELTADHSIVFRSDQLLVITEIMESINLKLPQRIQEMVISRLTIPAGRLSEAFAFCIEQDASTAVVQQLFDEFTFFKKYQEAEQLKLKYPCINSAKLDKIKRREKETNDLVTKFALKMNPFREVENNKEPPF